MIQIPDVGRPPVPTAGDLPPGFHYVPGRYRPSYEAAAWHYEPRHVMFGKEDDKQPSFIEIGFHRLDPFFRLSLRVC